MGVEDDGLLATSAGRLRVTFGWDCWVTLVHVDRAAPTCSRRVGKPRELAAVLAELGLPAEEARVAAAEAWTRRPAEATRPGDADPWTLPWDTGWGSLALFAIGLACIALLALVLAGKV